MVELKAKLIKWIDSPEALTWEDVLMLENLEKEHPYFQTIKCLIAKHYLDNNHILKTKKINTASTYSLNRNKLRNFLNLKPNKNLKETPDEEISTASTEVDSRPEIKSLDKLKEPSEEAITKEVQAENTELLTQEETEHTTAKETLEDKIHRSKPAITAIEKLELTESKPVTVKSEKAQARDNERKELLTAINKRLEELKTKKESYLEEVKQELPSPEKLIEEEQETNHRVKPISFIKLKGSKKIEKTKLENKNSSKTEEETVDLPATEPSEPVAPKDVFYSRLGNVLSSKSEDDIDHLLSYIKQTKESKTKESKPKEDIITKFIKDDPRIPKLQKREKETLQDLSKTTHEIELISENLARIHVKQGNNKKAISIYNKLILKFPEKKAYFANRIEKLKNK